MYSPTDELTPKTILMSEASIAENSLNFLKQTMAEEVERHAAEMEKYEAKSKTLQTLIQCFREAIEKME